MAPVSRPCHVCAQPIPAERLEAIPDATHCVGCLKSKGDIPRKVGRSVYEHKTAGCLEVVTPSQLEALRVAEAGMGRPGYGQSERLISVPRELEDANPHRDKREEGRIPNAEACRKIVQELDTDEIWPQLDAFERKFINSNRSATSFTGPQQLVCLRMAKKYDLKAWSP
jgi:hypothetical protein